MGKLVQDLIDRIEERIDVNSLQIKAISKGVRFTCTVLETDSCGMCFSIFNQDPIEKCSYIGSDPSLKNIEIDKILQFATSLDNGLERVIGISTLNALSQLILKRDLKLYQVLFNTNPHEHLKFHSKDRVVLIGKIPGFYREIRPMVRETIIIDHSLSNTNLPYVKNPDTTQEYLSQADIAIITGSAIANNTLGTLLKWCKCAREIVVVGPSAGMVPGPLFDRGVTILSSMRVLEPDRVLQKIKEGEGTPQFKKYCQKYNIIKM